MSARQIYEPEQVSGLCAACGIPMDSQYFDESGVSDPPEPGGHVVLARFDLPPQYCGVLEYFSQYTDAQAKDQSQIETPGLEWLIVSNNRALYPYLKLERVVNPWGYGSFQVSIRLDDGTCVEVIVRRSAASAGTEDDTIKRIGARIVGRYWYNAAYGDVLRRRR